MLFAKDVGAIVVDGFTKPGQIIGANMSTHMPLEPPHQSSSIIDRNLSVLRLGI
ncbi:MAG: hypothetical protein ACR2KF_03565 [Nitrososphaeraceae archaeon]